MKVATNKAIADNKQLLLDAYHMPATSKNLTCIIHSFISPTFIKHYRIGCMLAVQGSRQCENVGALVGKPEKKSFLLSSVVPF